MQIAHHSLKVILPVDIYETVLLADAVSRDGKEFCVFAGMNKEQVERLRELSLDMSDSALQENTGDYKRFGIGSYEEWYAGGRTIFTLIDKDTNDVAAIVWLGPKSLGAKSLRYEQDIPQGSNLDTQDWHTIAYRCYPNFRGQGLMKSFVALALDVYKECFPSAKIWAGMHSKNGASDALASSLGFETEEELCDQEAEWVVMVRK